MHKGLNFIRRLKIIEKASFPVVLLVHAPSLGMLRHWVLFETTAEEQEESCALKTLVVRADMSQQLRRARPQESDGANA